MEYCFTITHIHDTANVDYALSRRRHNKPVPPTLFACAVLEDLLPTAPPLLLRSDFGPAIHTALPSNPVFGPLAQEAQDAENRSVTHAGSTYVWHNGLLFRVSTRGSVRARQP